jgi:predicted RNA-binding Zn ribbon-like protein
MTVTHTELIEEFVNTLHQHASGDDDESLATAGELGAWLRSHGLLGRGRATQADLDHAIGLREALRTLLLANNAIDVDTPSAWAVIDETARHARIELRFLGEAPELVAAQTGVDGALGRIVVQVHAAIADGTWPRLKACRARDCEWAFQDNAKNQSRAWCSMKSCGNREKARAFRQRHIAPS